MNRVFGRVSVVMIVGMILVCLSIASVRAAEGESIVMSPTGKSLDLDAGSTASESFKIINDGTTAYDFKVYAAPYSVKNGSYDADFTSTPAGADAYTWVTFDKKQYHLEPGQNVDITYQITVPDDATPGGHYGVIFAETQPDEKNKSNVVAKKRVGMILYTAINGDYTQAGREVETIIPSFSIGGVPSATMTVENTGNAHFVSKETFRVKNILGEKVYERTMEHIILPKTTRDIGLVWEKGANLGWYTVETQSVILGKTVNHSGLVFVAPLWFLVAVTLVAFGIIYMLWRRFRR